MVPREFLWAECSRNAVIRKEGKVITNVGELLGASFGARCGAPLPEFASWTITFSEMGSHGSAGVALRSAALNIDSYDYLFGNGSVPKSDSWAVRMHNDMNSDSDNEDESGQELRQDGVQHIATDWQIVDFQLRPGRILTARLSSFWDRTLSFNIPDDAEIFIVASASCVECKVTVRSTNQINDLVTLSFEQTLKKLGADELFCDASFVASDVDIPVHRAIVAASSPVLKKMFTSELREGRDAKIPLTGTCEATARTFVNFLYGQKISSEACTGELLRLAHFYDVQPLVEVCVRSLAASDVPVLIEGLRSVKRLHEDASMQRAHKRLRTAWLDRFKNSSENEQHAMLDCLDL